MALAQAAVGRNGRVVDAQVGVELPERSTTGSTPLVMCDRDLFAGAIVDDGDGVQPPS